MGVLIERYLLSTASVRVYLNVADDLTVGLKRQFGTAPNEADAEFLSRQFVIERELRWDSIAASRDAVFQLARTHHISDALARK